jgi:hypothetical protein
MKEYIMGRTSIAQGREENAYKVSVGKLKREIY